MIHRVRIVFFHLTSNFWDIKVHLVPIPGLLCTTWGLEVCFRKWKLTFPNNHLFGGVRVLNKTSNMRKSELPMLSLPQCSSDQQCWKVIIWWLQDGLWHRAVFSDRCVLGWCNKIATCRKMGRAVLSFLTLTSPAMRLGDHANCEGRKYWAITLGRKERVCTEKNPS